jgi:uncharacterized phage protein (TIGR02218 family)
MKTLPANLKTHYQATDHTVAVCVRLARRDGQVFGFTALDRDIVVSGETYRAVTGINAGDATTASTMEVDNLNVDGPFNAAGMTEAALAAGGWDGATYTLFAVNWQAPGDGIEVLKVGEIGDISYSSAGYQATLLGLTAKLQNNIGRTILPTCDAAFGDARCGINKATWTVSAVAVTSVASQSNLTLSSLAQAAGWFNDGEITGVAGANAGVVREIRLHTAGGVLALHEALPYTVQVGDTFNVARGCSKIKGDNVNGCLFYANVINFRGFAEIPGLDALVRRPA